MTARAPTRADAGWVPDFRARYEAWLFQALPLLQAHQYGEAFRSYPFPLFDSTPWAPLRSSLAGTRLGVVTTAGVYRRGVDAPFADTEEGDARVVELPADVEVGALDVAHSHIPEALAREDMNVVLPLDPLRELVREGRLGGLAPRLFSLVGYQTRAHEVATGSAPGMAAAMTADGVSLALVVPV